MQGKRRWWIAGLFSIFCPGLGQIYNGRAIKGTSIFLIYLLFSTLALRFGPKTFYLGLSMFSCAVGTYFYSLINSLGAAWKSEILILKRYQRWYFYPCFCIISGLAVLALQKNLKMNYGEAFRVPSASMSPTIKVGDYLMVDKSRFADKTPERGNVVVLRLKDDPATPVDESISVQLKRVIAIGGDTVKLEGSKLFLNGKELDEASYARYEKGGWSNFDSETVPSNHVFLLGDNRDFSKDSRHWVPHFIENSQILGVATYVYWPPDRMGVAIE